MEPEGPSRAMPTSFHRLIGHLRVVAAPPVLPGRGRYERNKGHRHEKESDRTRRTNGRLLRRERKDATNGAFSRSFRSNRSFHVHPRDTSRSRPKFVPPPRIAPRGSRRAAPMPGGLGVASVGGDSSSLSGLGNSRWSLREFWVYTPQLTLLATFEHVVSWGGGILGYPHTVARRCSSGGSN